MPIGRGAPAAAPGPLLLDTHVWIWLLDGAKEKLSRRCLGALERGAQEGRLWVSAISVRELAMLQAKGRITLAMDCKAWVEAALRTPGLQLAELTPSIAVESARLPGEFHGDPADRVLVATAREMTATLVTRDASILGYGRRGHVAVLDAGR